ncbi:phosphomannomutase [Desulfobulbus alkaliphilus]|uniref:phosphomannomutase n=1 Tax=Desulfobulbus alkaliphilus TaxID=869814 RepID=UPI0019668B62|nr:phosphomannomutase [Desulfobulbus alkaliphilus]MBM9538118.1 phosphomannomutase [Desulfobulbus alkaliphilus]
MTTALRCFTAYDVRGRIPEDFDAHLARRIALACAAFFSMRKVVLGQDMRLSSPEIVEAMTAGLLARGVDVIDIGLCGTEEVYHAVFSGVDAGVDGGIIVTASHNPAEYNGMKIVRREARPVSNDSGLREIAAMAGDEKWYQTLCAQPAQQGGFRTVMASKKAYIEHLLGAVDCRGMRPLKLVVNSGNGCAGPVVDLLAPHLPFEFIRLQHQPDGRFPHGVPNPLLPEKRAATAEAVRAHGADLGIAWDGDFDRCFFYDENGRFIEGYYIVGLLATALLTLHPGATILHDPRLTWNTRELVTAAGGVPVMTRTGHAFIKEAMRAQDAVYGGEMSAHHYFRDFGYCDSGMLPWLLVCQLMSQTGQPLSALCDARMTAFPVSGEINSRVSDPDAVLARIKQHYRDGSMDYTDGISVEFPAYRFNLRASNTEPVLRLNVETRGDVELLERKTRELLDLIRS